MNKSPQRVTFWLWVGVLGLLAFALIPAMTRSHLEGFTYLTETMSVLLPDLEPAEPFWATSRLYFYLSRPGTIWAMAPLSSLSVGAGYNLLMWLVMPVFILGLVVVTRLWSGASWLASVAALLFMPIALEGHYFYNDNIVATAFALCGIALLLWRPHPGVNVLAGALLSIAVLCRLDQILMLPLYVVLGTIGAASIGSALQRLSGLLLGLLAVQFAMWMIEPSAANLILRFQVITSADALWGHDQMRLRKQMDRDFGALLLAYFAGIIAIVGGVGPVVSRIKAEWRGFKSVFERGFVLPSLLFAYPVAIYVVTVGKYYDPRGFLVVIPFVAPLIAIGLDRWLFGPLAKGGMTPRHWLKQHGMIAALVLAPLLVPGFPLPYTFLDKRPETENATKTLSGRIWQVAAWQEWQDTFRQKEAAMDRIVDTLAGETGPFVVVTTSWNDDRRFQNAQIRAGYQPAKVQLETCSVLAGAWVSPEGTVVYHLRTHIPSLPGTEEKTAAVLVAHGSTCLRSVPAEQRILTRRFGVLVSRPPPRLDAEPASDGLLRLSDQALDRLEAVAAETLLNVEGQTSNDASRIARSILAEASARMN